MVCAFIVMKCEGFTQITDLMDYLDNNRLIAHYCGFNIMEPLPSYWTYDRCLRQLNNGALKSIMADLVRKLYELGDGGRVLRRSGFHTRSWRIVRHRLVQYVSVRKCSETLVHCDLSVLLI